jgi:hypothetical protein
MVKEPKDISNIPIEIYQSLKVDTIPMTMYVYEVNDYTYYFDERKEIKTVHYTGSGLDSVSTGLIFLFVIVVTLLIGILIGTQIK